MLLGQLLFGKMLPGTYLCMAMMAVWSESKLMNPYPAGSPVNLLVMTLMLTTPLSPIMFMAFLKFGNFRIFMTENS
jgi:hypothetical protein